MNRYQKKIIRTINRAFYRCSCGGLNSPSVKNVDLVKALELFRYMQNFQSYGLGSGILLSTWTENSPWSCLIPESRSVKKVIIAKALELFSYLQNYQSYGLGSGILLSTGKENIPWPCPTSKLRLVKKVDIAKVLKLFSYRQNYQKSSSSHQKHVS